MLRFKDDTITGTMLSIVYASSFSQLRKEQRGCKLTFWITLKLYESSLWKTLDPTNMKDRVGGEASQVGHQEQSLVERLRIVSHCRASFQV